MRTNLGLKCALILLAASSTASTAVVHAAAKPNIVFILSDDQGWTGTSVQMDPDVPFSKSDFYQTPNLEALAARGMRFSDAYAHSACSMTRAAIQTGRSPAALQFTDLIPAGNPNTGRYVPLYTGFPLSPPPIRTEVASAETMIPEWLDGNNSGYSTAHIGKWHIGNTTSHSYDWTALGPILPPSVDPKELQRYTNSAFQFLDSMASQDKPFFMQVSHYAPHDPIEYLQTTYDKYAALPPGTRHNNVGYAAMTEDLDTAVGKLLTKIQDLGMEDNTYIIFGSDNGSIATRGPLHSAPLTNYKGSLYEGGIRTPMIVAGPGITPGSVSDVPVMLQDLFATVSDIAGLGTIPADRESASLLPIMLNNGQAPGGAPLARAYAPNGELFWHNPHYNGNTDQGDRVPSSAVRDGDWKLVREYGSNGQPDKVLLFNLAQSLTESNDPNSPLNLANAMPQKKAELLAKLNQWLQDTDASLPYDMSQNRPLHWVAAQRGVDQTAWRSTNDVDAYFLERWEPAANAANRPTLVTNAAVPAGLGGKSFHFDGNDTMSHEFFRVSDYRTPGIGDFNRSFSMAITFRTDTLAQNQVLIESGDGAAGMSLSLGDGDNDGSKDELRFRVMNGTRQLSVTTTLTNLIDPVTGFVEAVAVFNDSPTSRYIELYIDGQLAGHVNGTPGAAESIQWDAHNNTWIGYQHAGMGGAVGTGTGSGLGANGGSGDLPFLGNFVGDIAALSFFNYVLPPGAIDPSADFNGDGLVDSTDLAAWRNGMGQTAGGDADGDGDTDGSDFLAWQQQLGSNQGGATSGAVGTAVPEPASAGLAILGAFALLAARRRK